MTAEVFAVVEGGGTRFRCALVDAAGQFLARKDVPTSTPEVTLGECARFFRETSVPGILAAAGIACFGPLDVNPRSPDYGVIRGTPKDGWAGANPRAVFEDALGVPVVVDTDVAGSALGELREGSGQGIDNFVYFTVGTGIGGAVVMGGKPLRGASHFEIGHLPVRRHPDDEYAGCCPFHHDCVSALACGPAVEERWGQRGEHIEADHPAWDLEAFYLAQLVTAAVYSYAPQAVILGGGVMDAPGLMDRLRAAVARELGDYHHGFLGVGLSGANSTSVKDTEAEQSTLPDRIASAIRSPGLGSDSALVGAFHLARDEMLQRG